MLELSRRAFWGGFHIVMHIALNVLGYCASTSGGIQKLGENSQLHPSFVSLRQSLSPSFWNILLLLPFLGYCSRPKLPLLLEQRK